MQPMFLNPFFNCSLIDFLSEPRNTDAALASYYRT